MPVTTLFEKSLDERRIMLYTTPSSPKAYVTWSSKPKNQSSCIKCYGESYYIGFRMIREELGSGV